MVGKFGIAGSFALIYNYTAELYPVVVRSNGVGIGSIAGRVGGILFPFVLDLKGKVNNGHGEYLPMAIFGSLAIGKLNLHQQSSCLQAVFNDFSVATFLSCLFPDTTGTKNLTTIDEAIKFYAGELDDEDEDDENIKFIQ